MPADSGSQQVSIKFYDAVDSLESNERFRDVRPTGIYTGGYLSRVNDTTVTVSPFVCEVQSKVTSPYYQVKVETTAGVNVTVSTGARYLVIRWSYTGVAADDYAEMLGVASPDDRDVILGKCTFAASVLTGFTYVERHTPQVMGLVCRVEPEETPSMYVRVRAGMVQVGDDFVAIADQLTSVLVAPGAGSKTGAVYINDAGAIQVSSDFTWAGQLVLAEIALTNAQTTIVASDITDVRAFLTPSAIPDNTTIRRDSSTGLLETVPHTHAQLHNEAHSHSQLHDEAHIHGKTFKYLCVYNPSQQIVAQSSWTKVAFSTTVKSSGITWSNNRATLLAGKMYKIHYRAEFENTSPDSPRCKTRIRVYSGDTTWDLEEMSEIEQECGNGTEAAEVLTNSGTVIIIPASTTVIQMEAITLDQYNEDGKMKYATLVIWCEEVGAVA